ncbi:protocadherin Fat 1 [Trichonephila clavipes]|nr:protocadherin Fat 1 [Trichonephila clavipes]
MGDEIVDTLTNASACEVRELSAPLTFLEIFSRRTKHKNKTAWITHQSTIGISVLVLEGSLAHGFTRQDQTLLAHFRSDHIKTMKFFEGCKIFEMCTNCSSEPPAPAHILECLGLTKQDLADDPLLILDFLKETSCNVTSHAQKEFYISESNLLRVYWDGNVKDVVLRYEFLPFCSNRTFAGSPFGRFCSTGYPNVIFGCNTVYSIYVPLGFSIELQLNVLGLATGALCQNSTLDVVTRNYSIASEVQLMEFCLDASDNPKDSYILQSFQNTLDIRTFSNTDDLHKGFCATYKAVPQDPLRIVGCDYGWVSGDKFCYKVFEERLRWKEADEVCQMKRGRLASITDKGIAHLIDNVILTR